MEEGGICPLDTWAAGVAPTLERPALVVWCLLRHVEATQHDEKTLNKMRYLRAKQVSARLGSGCADGVGWRSVPMNVGGENLGEAACGLVICEINDSATRFWTYDAHTVAYVGR